jgi:GGDEF domain-containing protein
LEEKKKLSNLSDHKNVIPIRLGGDEFLLIIINRDQNYAEEIIKTLDSQNIDKPILETLIIHMVLPRIKTQIKPWIEFCLKPITICISANYAKIIIKKNCKQFYQIRKYKAIKQLKYILILMLIRVF